ncbi:MAG: 2-haloacid dehalogenase [Solirubrobacteraceae bacterium]|nr:2-haloacid dehalogenase [Solirubrobacteraceae bacterium]
MTFDCYGTLVDWEGGAAAFLYDLSLRNGERCPRPGRELRDRWEAIQFELLRGEYMPYRDVLARSLREWMDERGYPWRDEEGEALLRSMRSWQPFPDTRPALERARAAGMRLAIVSNTDRDIVEHTVHHIGVPFDFVITAQDARAYKPADAVFEYALERLDTPPGDILHVAFGFKYDIAPAGRFGMGTAWVNRHAEPAPGDARFDHEWRDLSPLADLAEAPRSD